MSSYKQQEFDFVNRTQKIIEQYDQLKLEESENFNVTLLINCLTGLLILPQQHWFTNLPKEIITIKKWGISVEDISFIKDGESKNPENIARHLRNSIAHYNYKIFSDEEKKLSTIEFLDFTDNTKEKSTFKCNLKIKQLRSFVEKLSNTFKDEMLKGKS